MMFCVILTVEKGGITCLDLIHTKSVVKGM